MRAYDLTVTGSLTVSGSTTLTGDITYDDLTATGNIITTGANKVISGSVTSTGSFGSVRATNGTATAPAYTFAGDGDTGMYLYGANSIGFTTGGTFRWKTDDTYLVGTVTSNNPAMLREAASSTNPVFVFYGDTDTGIGRAAADKLSFIANSKEEMVSYGPRLKEIIVQPNEWTASMGAFGEILPYHDNNMELDYNKKDKWGLPTVTFNATIRENEISMRKDMKEQADGPLLHHHCRTAALRVFSLHLL